MLQPNIELDSSFPFVQTEEKVFRYSGTQQYIRMVESSPGEETVHRCLVLDQSLSVIQREEGNIPQYSCSSSKGNSQQQEVKYEIKEQEQQMGYQFQRYYRGYPLLHDLLIGRVNWGRKPQAIKIDSELVSREHAKIVYNSCFSRKNQYLNSVREGIKEKTRISSPWRKLSNHLLAIIVDYAVTRPSYSLMDCNSRNGTFLIDKSVPIKTLGLNNIYQFQNQIYTLTINHISQNTGEEVDKLINCFENQRHTLNYRLDPQITYILPEGLTREHLSNCLQKMSVLQIQIFVGYQQKLYYWIINLEKGRSYSVGEGQTIAVTYRNRMEAFRKHGSICCRGGQWQLVASGQGHIWQQLIPLQPYHLTQNNYKLMIAHHSIYDLSFHNF